MGTSKRKPKAAGPSRRTPGRTGSALAALDQVCWHLVCCDFLFDVIEAEPWRVKKLQENYAHFAGRLREAGFDLLYTETAIVPVVGVTTERTATLAKYCQDRGIFVQAIVSPVVPEGQARLRACVSAAHTMEDIDYCADTIIEGGRALGIVQ